MAKAAASEDSSLSLLLGDAQAHNRHRKGPELSGGSAPVSLQHAQSWGSLGAASTFVQTHLLCAAATEEPDRAGQWAAWADTNAESPSGRGGGGHQRRCPASPLLSLSRPPPTRCSPLLAKPQPSTEHRTPLPEGYPRRYLYCKLTSEALTAHSAPQSLSEVPARHTACPCGPFG